MGLSCNQCTQKGAKLANWNFRGAIASVAPVVPLPLSTISFEDDSDQKPNEHIASNKTTTCGEQYHQ